MLQKHPKTFKLHKLRLVEGSVTLSLPGSLYPSRLVEGSTDPVT